MNSRLLAALAGSAILIATVMPAATMASGPSRRIDPATLAKIDPSFRPYLADASRAVTVVLQLADDAVLARPGLTREQQRQAAATLRAHQAGYDASVKAAGGKVTGRLQYAYNGIEVRAAGRHLAQLAALPGVVAVRPLRTYTRDNANAIPFIGAPAAWTETGVTGEGVTIAVIDTGIDYTHADFGGPGTTAAYDANDPTLVEAGTFPTAKVISGYDFAGNDYDATGDAGSTTPTPDSDPLDCGAHGTHVAATAAGQGVTAAHAPYTGPYTAAAIADTSAFAVSPGVAPKASLVALKVFGCEGSTDLVVNALEWVASYNASHADGIDVVNMSLGAPFGADTDPDAVATNALVDTGVVVVASAGNSGNVPYITGAPAAATKAISVAAMDALAYLPMATVTGAGADIPAINQNGYPTLPVSGELHAVPNGVGGLSLGCSPSDYDAASAGRIVAVKRGVCAFVDKGAAAQAAGAIGIIVVNRNDTAVGALPTYLGYNPEIFSIPMIGTDKTAQAALIAAEGATVTLASAGTQPSPTYTAMADFTSAGPREADGWLKPDVSAPGVSIFSALNGSGWNGTTYSGTSMASPVTAGVAALVVNAHPGWSPLRVKAAIANTADASAIADYEPTRSGSGVVSAAKAVAASVIATTSDGTASLSFGYEPTEGSWSEGKWITLTNTGRRTVRYTLAASSPLVTVSPSSVRVEGRESVRVFVRASLSAAQVAALPSADQYITGNLGGLDAMSGAITATPTSSVAGAYSLRVPYLLVPRGLSDVSASTGGPVTRTGSRVDATLRLRNDGGHAAYVSTYALGTTDPAGDGLNGTDIRAIGVQATPASDLGVPDPSDRAVSFVVNMWDRFATAAPHEIDVAVDTNGDGDPDRYVIGYDEGAIFGTSWDGIYLSLIFDAATFDLIDAWYADAPLNGSTIVLPALASDLGLADGAGSFSYQVVAIDGFTGLADVTAPTTAFDAYGSTQSSGGFVPLAPRSSATLPVWADKAAGARGWLVVALDDANGGAQADVVRVPSSESHGEGHH